MTFLEQITLRRPVCDAGFGRRRSSKAHPRRVNRRLTLIGICVVAPFIGPVACRVERVEARESRTAAKVIVRPVVTPVSVPRVALHQDEKGGPQVFVYSPAERRVHARGVALGTRRSGDVDIASGLGAGEMIVVALVINLFLGSDTFGWILSLVGVALFTGLTAYHVQRIANGDLALATGSVEKAAVFGALLLYLDFINLFLFLLRLFGGRR